MQISSIFKKLAVMSVFIFLALALAGCTVPFLKRGPSGPITLKYWGLFEPEQVLKPLIEKYQAEHPNVTITYEMKTPIDYRETVESRIEQGEGPDIFRFHNTWIPMLKEELAIVPKEIIDKETFEKDFYPIAAPDLAAPDGFYGIPLEFDGLGLYYNVDLLDAAGFTSPPTTWDQLRTMAASLTVKDEQGRIKTGGAALGTASNVDHFSDILAVMLMQNGVDLKNIVTGDPQKDKLAEDVLEFYSLFARLGQVERVWDETMEVSTSAFAAGRVAFYFAPSWRVFEIKNANPALNFRIASLPQLPGGKVAWASYWVEGVSQKSPHKKEALEFLKFLSESSSLQLLYSEASKIRLFGQPYSRVDLAQQLTGDPYVGGYVKDAGWARSFPLASNTFDNGLNDKLIALLAEAINSVNRGRSAKDVLSTYSKGANQVFSQFGLVPPASPSPAR
jgi:multiple sugar transport system substrate-binding protein